MRKLSIILIIFTLTVLVSVQDCEGDDCPFEKKSQLIQISDAAVLVDRETRRLYWYYLRKADMLFDYNFNTQGRFLFFFIYRNIVGTFLCICSWDKITTKININTIIRLGSGYSKKHKVEDPVKVDPFMLQFKLQQGEYEIELNQLGDFKVNGEIQVHEEEEVEEKLSELDQKTIIIDQFLRQEYWYYIKGAKLITNESIRTNERFYVLLTYAHSDMGAFLAIGNCDKENNIFINTFVRLGDQLEQQKQEEEPFVFLEPAIFIIT